MDREDGRMSTPYRTCAYCTHHFWSDLKWYHKCDVTDREQDLRGYCDRFKAKHADLPKEDNK